MTTNKSELRGRIQAAMPDTKFNKDLLAIQRAANELQEMLDQFWAEHDESTLTCELIALGAVDLDEFANSDRVASNAVDFEARAVVDVSGFRWALEQFIAVIDGEIYQVAEVREEEVAPCAVAGGECGG